MKNIENSKKAINNLTKYFENSEDNADFEINTIKELVEKATKKKVEQEFGYHDMKCPNKNCNHKIDKRYQNNCQDCGQALEWRK